MQLDRAGAARLHEGVRRVQVALSTRRPPPPARTPAGPTPPTSGRGAPPFFGEPFRPRSPGGADRPARPAIADHAWPQSAPWWRATRSRPAGPPDRTGDHAEPAAHGLSPLRRPVGPSAPLRLGRTVRRENADAAQHAPWLRTLFTFRWADEQNPAVVTGPMAHAKTARLVCFRRIPASCPAPAPRRPGCIHERALSRGGARTLRQGFDRTRSRDLQDTLGQRNRLQLLTPTPLRQEPSGIGAWERSHIAREILVRTALPVSSPPAPSGTCSHLRVWRAVRRPVPPWNKE